MKEEDGFSADAYHELSGRRDASWACGYEDGIAVSFGVVGWALALQRNAPSVVVRTYWTSIVDGERLYNCECPGCGVTLKALSAGVHEGTDVEWCGICRDSQ